MTWYTNVMCDLKAKNGRTYGLTPDVLHSTRPLPIKLKNNLGVYKLAGGMNHIACISGRSAIYMMGTYFGCTGHLSIRCYYAYSV